MLIIIIVLYKIHLQTFFLLQMKMSTVCPLDINDPNILSNLKSLLKKIQVHCDIK